MARPGFCSGSGMCLSLRGLEPNDGWARATIIDLKAAGVTAVNNVLAPDYHASE
jgi:hypothetical protein